MSKRTLLLIFVLAALAALFLNLALKKPSQVPAPTPTQIPTPTPVAQSELNFGSLSSYTAAPIDGSSGGLMHSLPILLKTGTNKVTAVQMELSFDPKVLKIVAVTAEAFFPNPVVLLNKLDQKNGRISYALGISPQDSGRKGQGTIATLTFESLVQTPTQTAVQFLPKSLVTAEGVTESVLKSTGSGEFTVGKP